MEIQTGVINAYTNHGVFLTKARLLYKDGKYALASIVSNLAKEAGIEVIVPSLELAIWANRYQILKDENLEKAAKEALYYENVVPDANLLITITENEKAKYIQERISAIKLLLLIPNQNIEQLCLQGMQELQQSSLEDFEKDNLRGALLNSLGAFLKKTHTSRAMELLNEGYDLVEKRTVIAGHLKQNLGDCYQNGFRDENSSIEDREESYAQALLAWETALEEYPKGEKDHRRSVENRLIDIKKEKEDFDKEKSNQ